MRNGGPAFPRPVGDTKSGLWNGVQDGMTLRDWFAGQSLAGLLSNPGSRDGQFIKTAKDFAKYSYQAADAMIAERDKGKK